MAMFLVEINKAKAMIVLDFITERILESVKTAIEEKNKYIIAKLDWLGKKNPRKFYKSIVMHLISKILENKFLK